MLNLVATFSSFAIKDVAQSQKFYTETLGLKVQEEKNMGLKLELPGNAQVFMYPKEDHQPATFTVLNLVVTDIDATVTELQSKGVEFEHYDEGMIKTDEKGIARGRAAGFGPDIAWFKDPSGNILSVLQD